MRRARIPSTATARPVGTAAAGPAQRHPWPRPARTNSPATTRQRARSRTTHQIAQALLLSAFRYPVEIDCRAVVTLLSSSVGYPRLSRLPSRQNRRIHGAPFCLATPQVSSSLRTLPLYRQSLSALAGTAEGTVSAVQPGFSGPMSPIARTRSGMVEHSRGARLTHTKPGCMPLCRSEHHNSEARHGHHSVVHQEPDIVFGS